VAASLLVITGLDPVIFRGTVLVPITGSSPMMTIGGKLTEAIIVGLRLTTFAVDIWPAQRCDEACDI
jgi:hypothetical protein